MDLASLDGLTGQLRHRTRLPTDVYTIDYPVYPTSSNWSLSQRLSVVIGGDDAAYLPFVKTEWDYPSETRRKEASVMRLSVEGDATTLLLASSDSMSEVLELGDAVVDSDGVVVLPVHRYPGTKETVEISLARVSSSGATLTPTTMPSGGWGWLSRLTAGDEGRLYGRWTEYPVHTWNTAPVVAIDRDGTLLWSSPGAEIVAPTASGGVVVRDSAGLRLMDGQGQLEGQAAMVTYVAAFLMAGSESRIQLGDPVAAGDGAVVESSPLSWVARADSEVQVRGLIMGGWSLMPESTRKARLLVAFVLPFVLHAIILLASHGVQGMSARWLLSGVVPLVIGFIYLERELGLHAAWLALVYVPVMMGLLLALNLVFGGLIFGASI